MKNQYLIFQSSKGGTPEEKPSKDEGEEEKKSEKEKQQEKIDINKFKNESYLNQVKLYSMSDWKNEVAIISTKDKDGTVCKNTIKNFLKTTLFIEEVLLQSSSKVYYPNLKNNNYATIHDNKEGNLHKVTDFVFTDKKVYHLRLLEDLKETQEEPAYLMATNKKEEDQKQDKKKSTLKKNNIDDKLNTTTHKLNYCTLQVIDQYISSNINCNFVS